MLPGCVPWPGEVAERYRREGYWRGETLGELLRDRAQVEPERPAIATTDGTWTYGRLDERADRLAAGLRALGVKPLDRVVVQLPNIPEFAALAVALFRLGALPVFALPAHRRNEILFFCRHAEAVALVVPDTYRGFDYRELAAEARAEAPGLAHVLVAGEPGDGMTTLADVDADPVPLEAPDPAEVAFFLLSGGTTGLPKLIPRTHDDYAYQLRACVEALDVDERSVYLAALPIAHNAALGCPGLLGTLRAGGRVALAASPSPDDAFPLVEREGATLTTLPPTFLILWMEAADIFGTDLSRVVFQVGSAHMDPAVARQVGTRLGARLTHWFGMAEGPLTYTRLDDPEDVVATTQGRPLLPADELRVVDPKDRDVGPDEVGELLYRGPTTLRGYYRAEEYNATAFTPDGFLRTGDLVRITPRGDMAVEGRVKDVINRGGEKVPAQEVEDHLAAHPQVRTAAVVAMPDPILGEKTCAFVIPADGGPTLDGLRSFLVERGLAEYKLPDRLELVDSLPYTSVGKANKAELRRRIADRLREPAAATSGS